LLFDEFASFEEGVAVDDVVLADVVVLAAVFEGELAVVAVVRVVALAFVTEEAWVEVEAGALVLDAAALDEVEDSTNTPAEDFDTVEEGEELPEDSADPDPLQVPEVLMLCQSPVMSPYVYSLPQL